MASYAGLAQDRRDQRRGRKRRKTDDRQMAMMMLGALGAGGLFKNWRNSQQGAALQGEAQQVMGDMGGPPPGTIPPGVEGPQPAPQEGSDTYSRFAQMSENYQPPGFLKSILGLPGEGVRPTTALGLAQGEEQNNLTSVTRDLDIIRKKQQIQDYGREDKARGGMSKYSTWLTGQNDPDAVKRQFYKMNESQRKANKGTMDEWMKRSRNDDENVTYRRGEADEQLKMVRERPYKMIDDIKSLRGGTLSLDDLMSRESFKEEHPDLWETMSAGSSQGIPQEEINRLIQEKMKYMVRDDSLRTLKSLNAKRDPYSRARLPEGLANAASEMLQSGQPGSGKAFLDYVSQNFGEYRSAVFDILETDGPEALMDSIRQSDERLRER